MANGTDDDKPACAPPPECDAPEGDVPEPVRRQIDDNLRRIYQRALDEEVPERLTQLLRRLREQDARR